MTDYRLFLFWTGANKPSEPRLRCTFSILARSRVQVYLIDQSNLLDWLIEPLHPSYEFLSYTHRADYLRAYFMHYFGGGYTDIKYCQFDWRPHFDALFASDTAIVNGYPESRAEDIASTDPQIRCAYKRLPGMCQFIFKPLSLLTHTWLTSVENILNDNYAVLQKHPGNYHPRATSSSYRGHNPFNHIRYSLKKYPLSWNQILGSVLHPLLYSTPHEQILLKMPSPSLDKYR